MTGTKDKLHGDTGASTARIETEILIFTSSSIFAGNVVLLTQHYPSHSRRGMLRCCWGQPVLFSSELSSQSQSQLPAAQATF